MERGEMKEHAGCIRDKKGMTSTSDRLKCLLSPHRYTVCMCVTVCEAVFICSDVQRYTDYRSVPVDERKSL